MTAYPYALRHRRKGKPHVPERDAVVVETVRELFAEESEKGGLGDGMVVRTVVLSRAHGMKQ